MASRLHCIEHKCESTYVKRRELLTQGSHRTIQQRVNLLAMPVGTIALTAHGSGLQIVYDCITTVRAAATVYAAAIVQALLEILFTSESTKGSYIVPFG